MPALRASMGYVGSVTFGNTTFGDVTIRAKRCDVRAAQEITYPEVVDGRIDTTLYQLGPRTVQGSVEFPLVHEGVAGTTCGQTINFGSLFWKMALERDTFGRLKNDSMVLRVRYNDHAHEQYPACLVNSLTISVQQSDTVNFSMELIGGANSTDDVRLSDPFSPNLNFLSPARTVIWSDFVINVFGDSGTQLVVPGEEIRGFEVTLNNNAERYFTLNNRLAPQDIAVRKRTIEGRLTIMGRNEGLSQLAYNNQDRFTSTAGIAFGYCLGANATPYWATGLHGVVYQIEEIEISPDLIETRVPFRALGDCGANYEATQIGGSYTVNNRPSGTNYGGPTAPGFPNFGN